MKHVACAFGICLLSISLGTAVAEPQLSVTLSSDEISVAEEIQVAGSVEWDAPGLLTDLYLGVMDDAGAIRFFYPGCAAPQACPTPFKSQIFLPQGYAIGDYFLAGFGGEMLAFSSLPGEYWMVLALTRRGYLDMVCEPAFSEFILYPAPRIWRREWGYSMWDSVRIEFDCHDKCWRLKEARIIVPVWVDGGSSRFQTQFICEMNGDWRVPKSGFGYFYESGSGFNYSYNMKVSVYPEQAELWAEVSYESGWLHGTGWRETCLP